MMEAWFSSSESTASSGVSRACPYQTESIILCSGAPPHQNLLASLNVGNKAALNCSCHTPPSTAKLSTLPILSPSFLRPGSCLVVSELKTSIPFPSKPGGSPLSPTYNSKGRTDLPGNGSHL